MSTIEQRLRLLEDEQEILNTLYAYGHSLDYGLEADWLNCWHEEAVLKWPNREPIKGHAVLTAVFRHHTHAPAAYHKHIVVEPVLRIDGDQATAACYFARLDRYPSGPHARSFGRYIDKLVRCPDGRWRFMERIAEREASRAETPIGAHPPA